MASGVRASRLRWHHFAALRSRPLAVCALVLLGVVLVAAPVSAIVLSGHHVPGRTAWAHRHAGNLAASLPSGGTLLSVLCPSTRSCVTVGDNETRSGPRTLTDVWNGRRWRATDTPREEDDSEDDSNALLSAVSCPEVRSCVAVGSYFERSGLSVPLAEAWNGSRWRILATPSPAAHGGTGSTLTGVSCLSTRDCIAVGDNQTRSGVVTLTETWDGRRWRIGQSLNVAHARVSQLTKVSCSGAEACTAVGTYVNSSGQGFALAERWNGATWRIQTAANVAGAAKNGLSGVSCPSARTCVAVGSYEGGPSKTLTEIWNGINWSIQPTPNPEHAIASTLANVSCRSASSCTAVGYYQRSSDSYATLIEAWNGTAWHLQTSPGHGTASNLYGVSCPDANRCIAVGGYTSSSGDRVMLTEEWNGTTWSIQRTPDGTRD
jgi:hypothetical protein